MSGVLIRDKDGIPLFMAATAIDITERKQAEEMFRALADSSPIGIFICQDGRFQYVNPQMQKQIGYSSRELLGRKSLEVVLAEDRDKVRESAIRMLKGKQSQPYEYRALDKKGNIRWVLETVASIMYQGRRATVGNRMDITERKSLEEERQKVEKLESVGTLAGGIAHDFNNILTVIMGNISMAGREVEPGSRAADRLEEAEKASLRARDLTHRMLTFARGGAPIKKTVSIAELVREATTFGLRGSNVSGNYVLPDDLWSVEADEGQINQVITNLVINAVEAMPMGGILDISAKNYTVRKTGAPSLPKGSYVEITVADHGTGMSKAHLERIFEPYFTTKQRGSGLGLATSYSIIKNHGGHITVESELGVGTTFHIYLPASGKPVPVKAEIPKELPITGKGRILVMDDEENIRLLLSKMLTRAGYEVELVENGEEAIKKYAEAMKAGTPFAAVIMDLTIPGGMGGREAIKRLREVDPEVKAIVSSGYSTDPIMAGYREYGFSGVIAKPYQAGEVEKTLRDVVLDMGE
jgi:PAS domain S-box-containing protein